MKPVELKTPPEQTQTITRVIFDILKEHGPLTIADTWEHVKEVGLRGLNNKRHMKIVLRWMRERQKVRLLCNHVGPNKQFLYTTRFTKPDIKQSRPPGTGTSTSISKSSYFIQGKWRKKWFIRQKYAAFPVAPAFRFVANCLNRLKLPAGGRNVVNLAVLIILKGRCANKASVP